MSAFSAQDEYRAMIEESSDKEYLQRTERSIWLSAFASNNSRAPAHWRVDMDYDEARRRGKPWLYQQAYNAALRSCGYKPADSDVEAARPVEVRS